jgi:hypothetical protein
LLEYGFIISWCGSSSIAAREEQIKAVRGFNSSNEGSKNVVVSLYYMRTYGEVVVWLHAILTSVLDKIE